MCHRTLLRIGKTVFAGIIIPIYIAQRRKERKMFKKLLTLIMAFGMISTGAIAAAETVPAAGNVNRTITVLSDFGIIDLTKENPDKAVTRGEMIALIAHVLNCGEIPAVKEACVFTDVTDASLINAVMWAYGQKIVLGTSETKFNPDADITMQEAYLMVVRAMGYSKFSSVDVYAIDKNLKEKKLDDSVTYSDAATLLYNMLSCPSSGDVLLMEKLYGKKELKVVTFNSKCTYSEEEDGINFFFHRIGLFVDKINKENPDVICFQEIYNAKAVDFMTKNLPDYEFIGPGTKMNNSKHTGVFTAVKKGTCDILGWESLYLSDEPYTPDSRFEGQSKNPRICVQALIRHKASKKMIRVFNTHLDHASKDARIKGMNVVLNFMDSFKGKGGYPIMLMGDFNALPDEEAIVNCKKYEGITEVSENIGGTYHAFGTITDRHIDYMFMSDELANLAGNAEIWPDVKSGIYMSDHHPVCSQVWFD